MLKVRNNTKAAPVKLRDIIARGELAGCKDLISSDLFRQLNDDWIYYITQDTTYKYGTLTPFSTNIITAFIYDNFRERTMLEKYADEFIFWEEENDFSIYMDMVKRSIEYVLKNNNDRYKKLYYSTIAEFNPLWNVDGTELTERELRQTGTDTRKKTGDDTNVRSGNETDAKTGTEANTRTGSESNVKSGTDTKTTSKTAYDTATFYDTEKVVDAPDDLTDEKTYNNVKDETSYTNRTDTHTFNNVQDKITYNNTDQDTRNLTDKETIKVTRGGNIGVTTTTKLLTEYREFADFNFLETVAKDIVNAITYMTY